MIVDDETAILEYYRKVFTPEENVFDILGTTESNDEMEIDLQLFSLPSELIREFGTQINSGYSVPLCILDMRMPEMSGLETALELRKIDSNTIIIICTAFSDSSADKIKSELKSGVFLVHKPFAPDEFNLLVHSILREWEAGSISRKNEERLRLIIEGTHVATWEWNVETGETVFNERWAEIIGYTLEELSPTTIETWVRYTHPEDLARSNDLLSRHFSKKLPSYNIECRMKHKDGYWVWVHDRGRVMTWTKDGKPLIMYGIHTDISERKSQEELILAEHDYSANIIKSSPSIICLIRADGVCTSINPAGESVTGYSANELIMQNWWRMLYPGDEYVQVEQLFHDFSNGDVHNYEMALTRKDGEKRTVSWNSTTRFDSEGLITEIIGFGNDITDQKNAEVVLNRTLHSLNESLKNAEDLSIRAQQAVVAKSEFLANMSHEIRTPMNGVIGMTSLLLGTELTTDQLRYTKTMQSSGEALLEIINDILDFSKIEAGKLHFEEIQFDLQVLVDDFSDSMALRADEKGIEWNTYIETDVSTLLRGDPGRLRQILTNLVGNALKFTAEGEVSLKISTDTSEYGLIRFEISDTGIGIAEDKLDQLFEKFSQVDASTNRKYGGTGLGLAISKQLTTLMGGTIGVRSQVSQGSTFWFTVKFQIQESGFDHTPVGISELEGVRVLIVDDNATARILLVNYTTSLGMIPVAVSSGSEALAELDKSSVYACVIIDRRMPDISGDELGMKIRENRRFDSVRLLMITSLANRGDMQKLSHQGFNGFLPKPIRTNELSNVLKVLLNKTPTNFFALPVAENQIVTRHSAAEHIAKQTSGNILLVEDNMTNQMVAHEVLQGFGYKVDVVNNGKESLNALLSKTYDLVLMDCQMPEMDGYEATRRIRSGEIPGCSMIPIIAMTANAMLGDREKCLEAGMDGFVTKPFEFEVLRKAISEKIGDMNNFATSVVVFNEHEKCDTIIFNKDDFLRRVMNKPALALKILNLYFSDMPVQIAELERLLATKDDLESLVRQAHTIKGASANVGAEEMRTIAATMENDAQENQLKRIDIAILKAAFERFKECSSTALAEQS